MPTDEHLTRPKRKDAARNNDLLMQAAREVFARQGLSATLDDIALEAGVGMGTIYRNFANKRDLVETLYHDVIGSLEADVQTAMQKEDPWDAITTFFEVAAATQANDRGLCEKLLGRDSFTADDNVAQRMATALAPLFDRAKAAGVLRKDATPTDIGPIFAMLNGIYGLSTTRPELWRRYLSLILDGFRAVERPAIIEVALSIESFNDAIENASNI